MAEFTESAERLANTQALIIQLIPSISGCLFPVSQRSRLILSGEVSGGFQLRARNGGRLPLNWRRMASAISCSLTGLAM
jgi:hypothetical protein